MRIGPVRSAPRCRIRNVPHSSRLAIRNVEEDGTMDGLIYLIGLIVVIMAILSFFGLR
ncbi:hypothetical protein [Bradyrhizobium sp. AC87j1]|uniref:hypothetical protein n=1 Tax=Bradyrhizobium sp. AC87j1 TaxID=2055894 RepID=UPI001374D81E|nr:hypothetical protein [Bradyrhizobium sp. AC87j1]